jgi:hypothetical protein
MLPLLPLYDSNLISHHYGTKADSGTGSALARAAFFRHPQLEVETDTRKFANDGD